MQTEEQNGRIMVLDVRYNGDTGQEFNTWKDATEWTMEELKIWLGY